MIKQLVTQIIIQKHILIPIIILKQLVTQTIIQKHILQPIITINLVSIQC